jgi:hypothetical protein
VIDDDELAAVIAAAHALLQPPVPAPPMAESRWRRAARLAVRDASVATGAGPSRWKFGARLT